MRKTAFLLAGLLALTQQSPMKNQACQYKQFPIFAGGSQTDTVYALEVRRPY